MGRGTRVAVAAALLGTAALVFVFRAFTPTFPQPGLDPSWIAVMGRAADVPERWGIDTVFSYGPASPLVTGFANAAVFTRTLPLEILVAALFGWCTALLVASRPGGRAAVVGTLACGLMVTAARGTPDVLFLTLPALVLLLSLRPPAVPGAGAAPLAAAFALGITAMVKMSFPLAALPLLVLGDAVGLARRRVPRLLPLFALGIVAGALLYGQRLSDLPAYVALQGEVVAGYAAAMALDGPDWDLASFVCLSSALLLTFVVAGRGPGRWTVAAGLGLAVLFLFKVGFIRHDLHALIAWTGLALIGTVAAWNRLDGRTAAVVTAVACFVVLVYEPVLTIRQTLRQGRGPAMARLYGDWFVGEPARQGAALLALLRDPAGAPARIAAETADAWRAVAQATPVAPLAGSVDVLPSIQAAVMAAGLSYRGRPSFQGYASYTPALAAANRAFLEGPEAPRWMLFGPETPYGEMAVDGRAPGLAEGALWPDLLRLYRPDHRDGALVALDRRATPASLNIGPPRTVAAAFDGPVPVGDPGPVWATLDIRLNLAGQALAALFRPPLLDLAVDLDDGTERRFRLVPGLASAGFLLSPLVDNASDYEVLATGRPAGAARRVVRFTVRASRLGRLFYAPGIAVSLRALDTSGLGEGAPPPASPADVLRAALASRGGAAPASSGRVVSLPLWGIPVTDGHRSVVLRYGVEAAATNGPVCFAAVAADGRRDVLARRCLDAASGNGSAGVMALDVPDGVTELALVTTCGRDRCAGTWSAGDGATASAH